MGSVQEKIHETPGMRRVVLGLRDEIQHRTGGVEGRQSFSGAVSSELAHFLRPRILEHLRHPGPASDPAM